jgi:alginate O-acetyltransferase complex protein AlgJ
MRFRQQLPPLGLSPGRLPGALLAVAVLGTLFAPALIQLTGRQTDPSFLDNRAPAPVPALPSSRSLEDWRQFRSGLTNFVDDNFGLRAEMVKLSVRLRGAIGVSAIPSMLVGKEGWFFLKTDADVLDQVRGLNRFTDEDLDEWIDLMEAQQRWVNAQGAAFIVLIAPNQHTIYPEYLPRYVNRVWPETRFDQIMRRLQERGSSLVVVDPRPDLWAAKPQAMLYRKYEAHWNALGAFIAYSATMKEAKQLVPSLQPLSFSDYAIRQGYTEWNIPPLGESDPVLTLISGTRVVARQNDASPAQPINETVTHLQNAPTALIYGDSFGYIMQPFFDETFRRTIQVPNPHWPFPSALIQQHKPDLVILEMVERHVARRTWVSEAIENEYLMRKAPSLSDAIARSSGFGGTVAGVVDSGGKIALAGSAADDAANAKLAFAYYDGRAVGVGRMSAVRLDTGPNKSARKVAFQIVIPSNVVKDPARLRFFGTTTDGRVYELPITPALRRHLQDTIASSGATSDGSDKGDNR